MLFCLVSEKKFNVEDSLELRTMNVLLYNGLLFLSEKQTCVAYYNMLMPFGWVAGRCCQLCFRFCPQVCLIGFCGYAKVYFAPSAVFVRQKSNGFLVILYFFKIKKCIRE